MFIARLSWQRRMLRICSNDLYGEFITASWFTIVSCTTMTSLFTQPTDYNSQKSILIHALDLTVLTKLIDTPTIVLLLWSGIFLSVIGLLQKYFYYQYTSLFSWMVHYLPLAAPYCLRVLAQAIIQASPTLWQAALMYAGFFAVAAAWALYVLMVRQTADFVGFRISRAISLFGVCSYIAQPLLLLAIHAFGWSAEAARWSFLLMCLATSSGCLYLKLERYEYANHQVQYFRTLCYLLHFFVALALLLSHAQHASFNWILCLPPLILLLMHFTGCLKQLFLRKYKSIIYSIGSLKTAEELIVLTSTLQMQSNFQIFSFDLQKYHEYANITIRLSQNKPFERNLTDCQTTLNYLINEADRISHASFHVYLASLLLLHSNYLQTIKQLSLLSALQNRSQWEAEFQLLQLQVEEYLEQESASTNISDGELFTCFTKKVQHLNISQVFEREQIICEETRLIQSFLSQKGELNQILLSQDDDRLRRTESAMLQIDRMRDGIDAFVARNHECLSHKRFAAAYYVYLRSGCKLFYEIPRLLEEYFRGEKAAALAVSALSLQRAMVCLVSGESRTLGTLLNANVTMKEFFGLSDEKIQMRLERVDRILPDVLIAKHNELMVRFKKTGVSTVLGKIRTLYVVRDNSPYCTRAAIKVLPSIDGLMFSGCLEIVNDGMDLIILDKKGAIRHYSKSLETNIRRNGVLLTPCELTRKAANLIGKPLQLAPKQIDAAKISQPSLTIDYLTVEDVTMGIGKIPSLYRHTFSNPSLSKMSDSSAINQVSITREISKAAQLESAIYSMKLKELLPYQLYGLLLTVYAVAIGWLFCTLVYSVNLSTQVKSIGSLYLGMAEGLRIKNYYLSSRTDFTNAIQIGKVQDTVLASSGVSSFQSYLLAPSKLVTSLDGQLTQLLSPQPVTLRFYSLFLTANFQYKNVNMDLLQYLTITKSYMYETMGLTPSDVSDQYATISQTNNWMVTVTNTAVRDLINTPYKNSTSNYIAEAEISLYAAMGAATLVSAGLLLGVMCTTKKIAARKQQSISVLWMVPRKIYRTCTIDYNIKISFLQNLRKNEMSCLHKSHHDASIRCTLRNGSALQTAQQQHTKKQTDSYKSRAQPDKQTQGSFFYHKADELYILLLLLLLLGVLSWRAFVSLEDVSKGLNDFYNYMDNAVLLRTSQAGLTDIAIKSVIVGKLSAFDLMNRAKYITVLKDRSLENVLRYKLSWSEVQTLLYAPLCPPDDFMCAGLLGGALNINMPSTMVAFSNEVMQLSSASTLPLSILQRRAAELFVATMAYVQPALKLIHKRSLDVLELDLDKAMSGFMFCLKWVFIPLLAILTSLLLAKLWRERDVQFRIYRQAMTQECVKCRTVDAERILGMPLFYSACMKIKSY